MFLCYILLKKGVPVTIYFTTNEGLHHYTEGVKFEGYKIQVFGFDQLCRMLDNNYLFWDKCREIVKNLVS